MTAELTSSSLWIMFFIMTMAFLYASVGHGGASGYLAVLALFGTAPMYMKTSALLLNVFVSFISFAQYYRSGHFHWRLFWPFALTSIPLSYVGASLPLSDHWYRKVLGICLLFAVGRLLGIGGKDPQHISAFKQSFALAIGAVIGLLSGMIGIGGGIILSPVILLLHWAKMKEAAAISALFILVNSLSGLLALVSKGFTPHPFIYMWLMLAIMGGWLGAYFGSKKFDHKVLEYLLALVLLIACIKLLVS